MLQKYSEIFGENKKMRDISVNIWLKMCTAFFDY